MKKLLVFVMSTLMLMTSLFCGCVLSTEEQGEVIDENKTQLNIAVASDGIGQDFYNYLKAEYEKRNPNVQVMIQNRHAVITGNGDRAVEVLEDDIMIHGFENYKDYGKYLLDITDLYDVKAYDANYKYVGAGNGTVSISDRLSQDNLNYFNCGTASAEKYKVFPFYDQSFAIWYDVDLFEDNNLYDPTTVGYAGLDGTIGTSDDGYGPDGEEGTFDDGMPATFEDFKKLCLYMKEEGIATRPLVWSAVEDWMQIFGLDYINASYEGKNDYTLMFTMDGEHSMAGTITPETAWKLSTVTGTGENKDMPYRQGEKAVAYFCEFIDQNELYSEASLLGTQTHTAAQTDFLNSVQTADRSAFLIDGSWWQYEARETFNEMAEINEDYALDARKFSIMPMFRFIGTAGIRDQANTKNMCPVKPGSKIVPLLAAERNGKREIVEDFLLFTQDNTVLCKFIEINRMMTTSNIILPQEEIDNWNYMARSLIEYGQDKNTEKYYYQDACAYVEMKECYHKDYQTFLNHLPYGSLIPDGKGGYQDRYYLLEDMCLRADGSLTAKVWWDGAIKLAEEKYGNPDVWPVKSI